MNSNDKNKVDIDIQELRKKVYLEDPDLWFKFTDKVNENIFDEMILFYACKYNYLSIVKYAVDNNLIDLYSSSHDKRFETILSYLSFTSNQSNSLDVYNYFKNLLSKNNTDTNIDIDTKNNESISTSYLPSFICPSCSCNILEHGYSVSENIVYKFCAKQNKCVEVSRDLINSIICCNCNSHIKETSLKDLENICSIQNCRKCGMDLTVNGIVNKSKMEFDNNSNKFMPKLISHHCSNCDNEINKDQLEYFNIIS